jgi:hypothetical protein
MKKQLTKHETIQGPGDEEYGGDYRQQVGQNEVAARLELLNIFRSVGASGMARMTLTSWVQWRSVCTQRIMLEPDVNIAIMASMSDKKRRQ